MNSLELTKKKRSKVIGMYKFYESNLHMIIMKKIKRELRNLGIYKDFMRVVRVQFSKKNEVMVDKDNMTYGSFLVHTEIVDDLSEMSSYSHDINIFIKKSGLTNRVSRRNSRRNIRKKKTFVEKFIPKRFINRAEYGQNKSKSPRRNNHFEDNKVLIRAETHIPSEDMFSITSLRSKNKKKSILFKKLKPRGKSVDNDDDPGFEEIGKDRKVKLFDLLNCENKKKSSRKTNGGTGFFGPNIGRNVRTTGYNSLKVHTITLAKHPV